MLEVQHADGEQEDFELATEELFADEQSHHTAQQMYQCM